MRHAILILLFFMTGLMAFQSTAQTSLNTIQEFDGFLETMACTSPEPETFRALDSVWKRERKNTSDAANGRINTKFERTLEHNYYQTYYELYIASVTYSLNLIQKEKGKEWVYLTLKKNKNTIFEKKDSSIFAQTPTDELDIDYYGTFCGYVGRPPKACYLMLQAVRENEYGKLASMVHSLNPELAVYGYAGLYYFERRDGVIRKPERERMKKLATSSILVHSCRGCYFGMMEKTSDLLKEELLTAHFETFSETGWLRN